MTSTRLSFAPGPEPVAAADPQRPGLSLPSRCGLVYELKNASRSGLSVSGFVESMPCGNPSYVFRVPRFSSFIDNGADTG